MKHLRIKQAPAFTLASAASSFPSHHYMDVDADNHDYN